ncbi:Nuclear GTPase SLIP-GC [Colletotrichum sidae]|uniref:Nuclear GTPase SLIP-GC n=1 Tax=Colletotrichum sidae TaxID=1347389 RepID=A0A4R8SMW2_9PEZI|nr:Nuclear GTPase SLIP-GC [Colletotrichum sidae]
MTPAIKSQSKKSKPSDEVCPGGRPSTSNPASVDTMQAPSPTSRKVDGQLTNCDDHTLESLEKSVKMGKDVLNNLECALAAAPADENQASVWLSEIKDMQSRSQPAKTVVGVVGSTGAGKSSVINAILEEETLLPTSCYRACTACATEISYNYSDDPSELYRADVEFITARDWIKELETLFTDLLDNSGNFSRDCTNPDSDAGIAYAKIKAVHPHKTREMISESTPEQLAGESVVRGVLGSVKTLKSNSPEDLYANLQRYVDSKEKRKTVSMEYWPLIKVVRIYTKAHALSTGAVIVDLPGLQDSNAARAAVAQQYVQACTGLWIVAPINRAVDDKTAKYLLGDSFKRQLKYDGIMSGVTYICSKADDISITEAANSLEIGIDVPHSWSRIEDLRLQVQIYEGELDGKKTHKSELSDVLDRLESDQDQWDGLAQKHANGEVVFGPSAAEGRKSRKQEALLLSSIKADCIQGRNEYSKTSIQRDFAAGIKELDEEAAIEDDAKTFNPDEDARDYDEVAQNLPVFCVSSRAYQKLCGRFQKDNFSSDGFRDVDETEIPQLQKHVMKMAEDRRAAHYRSFLNSLSQLLNSMQIWASSDGTRNPMRDAEDDEQALRVQLAALKKELFNFVNDCLILIKDALSGGIYDYFEATIPTASEAAVPTARSWGALRKQGGMAWATYKATCRRSGVYKGAAGPRDLNAELFEPISRQLASCWDKTFQHRLPQALERFTCHARLLLKDFHEAAINRSGKRDANAAGINMLGQQLRTRNRRIIEIPAKLRTVIQELQREANRGFHPVIAVHMQPAYDRCVLERGEGSFGRMKDCMTGHVEQVRHTMFRHSTDSVKEQLQGLYERAEDSLVAEVQDIYDMLARDYTTVLVGLGNQPTTQQALLSEVLGMLVDVGHFVPQNLDGRISRSEDGPVQGNKDKSDEAVNDDKEAGDLLKA